MKVVLFCGGLGMRMRADNQSLPKPMVPIGSRPVLWHIMRYFAHFGHTEFVLCLGHGANAVKDYFLDYRETASNDFVLTKGGHAGMLIASMRQYEGKVVQTSLDDEEEQLSAGVKKLLTDAINRAEESPLPDPSSLTEGVFATPEDLDTPHHK